MTTTLIISLAFLWGYNYWRLRQQKDFNKFLQNENWQQRKLITKCKLQLNDSNFYLEKMTDNIEPEDEDGCSEIIEVRRKKCKFILKGNYEVLNQINNLSE